MWFTTTAAMWSGSRRGMPGRPKRIVDCGMSRSMTCGAPPAATSTGAISTSEPAAGRSPKARSSICPSVTASMAPTAAILQVAPRQRAAVHVHEVAARHGGERLGRAAHGVAVGVAREGGFAPAAARQRVGVLGLAAEARRDLGAHALDRVRVEARRAHGEAQQVDGLLDRAAQRLQPARHGVAVGAEGDLDGAVVERAVEALGVEVAGALVEQARHHGGGAGLAVRVLGGAALEGEVDGDERHRIVLDQPGLDAARRAHLLHGGGAGDGLRGGEAVMACPGEAWHGRRSATAGTADPCPPARGRSGRGVSGRAAPRLAARRGTRKPVTARFLSARSRRRRARPRPSRRRCRRASAPHPRR